MWKWFAYERQMNLVVVESCHNEGYASRGECGEERVM